MKSKEILPENRRLNKHHLLALSGHGSTGLERSLGEFPKIEDYHSALEAAEKELLEQQKNIDNLRNIVQKRLKNMHLEPECYDLLKIISQSLGIKFQYSDEEEN